MKKFFRFVLFMLLIIVVYLSFSVTPPFITKSRVGRSAEIKITGHRGAAGLAPENTLPAVRAGLKYQVDRIEIDVRQTKDSALVVMHDSTIDRTTNGSGLVYNLTLQEIKELNAGSWYSPKFASARVPTLEEVIAEVKGKAELLIEIKEGSKMYPGIEQRVVEIVNESGMKQDIIVQSFYDDVLFLIYELDPEIRLHKLFMADSPWFHYDGDGFRVTSFDRYDFVEEFAMMQYFVSYRFLKKAKEMDKRVNVWTIRDEKKGKKFMKMNVGGIITDNPDFFNEPLED